MGQIRSWDYNALWVAVAEGFIFMLYGKLQGYPMLSVYGMFLGGISILGHFWCLSFQGMRCEVCYRACPLIDEAITIDYRPREGDDIHAVFAPQVVPDVCPGCGLCEQRCPVSDPAPAIVVVPAGAQEETYVARRNGAA